jgi:hypothetical protein
MYDYCKDMMAYLLKERIVGQKDCLLLGNSNIFCAVCATFPEQQVCLQK